jgi:hypothetical protein
MWGLSIDTTHNPPPFLVILQWYVKKTDKCVSFVAKLIVILLQYLAVQ